MAKIKISSNIDSVLSSIQKKINDIDASKISRAIAISLNAMILNRIQERGRGSNNQKLGTYSTKPTVINNSDFALTKVPKTGANRNPKYTFQGIKQPARKKGYYGVYFKGGYKEFRQKLGLNTRFVDVTLTGQMTNDFATTLVIISPDEVALGFTNQFNADKAGWMEDKYGEIFELTPQEEKMASQIAEKEIKKILGI